MAVEGDGDWIATLCHAKGRQARNGRRDYGSRVVARDDKGKGEWLVKSR
jgi:hypothetical protein